MNTYYLTEPTKAKSYGSYTTSQFSYEEKAYIFPDLLCFGDYDRSCHIERSNVRVFRERHAATEGKIWHHVFGMYGSEGIAILADYENMPEAQEIAEDIAALADYPCLDDQDASAMEMAMVDEYLPEFIKWDLCEAIDKSCGYDANDYDEDQMIQWVRQRLEEKNMYPSIEAGGNVYIDAEKLAEGITEMPEWYKGEKWD